MVFQDPYSSLDRRQSVRSCLREALDVHRHVARTDRERRVDELLDQVGLSPDHGTRLPHSLSGESDSASPSPVRSPPIPPC